MNLKSISSPPNSGKVIKFHKKCGRSIKISDSFTVANKLEQSEPNGIVFSDRAILPGEIVLLRACGKISTKFTEPLKIGLTIRDPSTLRTEKLCRLEKEFGSWIIPVFDFNTFSGTKHPVIHLCVLADNQDSLLMRLHQGVDGTNKVIVDMLCSSAKQFWVVLYMPANAPSMKFVGE
uniref:NHR domain-containing protein n=1 Tax=Ditylenchus dipsaci TaxID=166011 RepID=A0A915E048_9BILA